MTHEEVEDATVKKGVRLLLELELDTAREDHEEELSWFWAADSEERRRACASAIKEGVR